VRLREAVLGRRTRPGRLGRLAPPGVIAVAAISLSQLLDTFITDEEKTLMAIFDKLDIDKDGTVSLEELTTLVSRDPTVACAQQAYKKMEKELLDVVEKDHAGGDLVIVGGIYIDLPPPCGQHFLPCLFEMRGPGKPPVDLTGAFACPLDQGIATDFSGI